MTPMASPWARAMSRRSEVLVVPAVSTAPAPMKISVNAPTNSATAFRQAATAISPPPRGRKGEAYFYFLVRQNATNASRDVRRGAAIEAGHELELQLGRLPRGVREDEIREEPRRVARDLRDDVVRAEQRLEDAVRLLAAHPFIDEADRVQVLVQEDVEGVRLVQGRVRLLDPEERHLVHHDHVARDRIEGAEESLRVVAEVREGEHQTRSGAAEDRLDGSLHELVEIGERPGLIELPREVHRGSQRLGRT